jgi:hypothetical protein
MGASNEPLAHEDRNARQATNGPLSDATWPKREMAFDAHARRPSDGGLRHGQAIPDRQKESLEKRAGLHLPTPFLQLTRE